MKEPSIPVQQSYSAPIRACLGGEDLDWLGYASCCVALDLRTRVSLSGVFDPHESEYSRQAWRLLLANSGIKTAPPPLYVSNEAPITSGLSSSTSLTVAILQAYAA